MQVCRPSPLIIGFTADLMCGSIILYYLGNPIVERNEDGALYNSRHSAKGSHSWPAQQWVIGLSERECNGPLELIWLFSRPEEYHESPDSIHALLRRLVSISLHTNKLTSLVSWA